MNMPDDQAHLTAMQRREMAVRSNAVSGAEYPPDDTCHQTDNTNPGKQISDAGIDGMYPG